MNVPNVSHKNKLPDDMCEGQTKRTKFNEEPSVVVSVPVKDEVVTEALDLDVVKMEVADISSITEDLPEGDTVKKGVIQVMEDVTTAVLNNLLEKVSEIVHVKEEVSEVGTVQEEVSEAEKVQEEVFEAEKVQEEVFQAEKVQEEVSDAEKVQEEVSEAEKVQEEVYEAEKVQEEVSGAEKAGGTGSTVTRNASASSEPPEGPAKTPIDSPLDTSSSADSDFFEPDLMISLPFPEIEEMSLTSEADSELSENNQSPKCSNPPEEIPTPGSLETETSDDDEEEHSYSKDQNGRCSNGVKIKTKLYSIHKIDVCLNQFLNEESCQRIIDVITEIKYKEDVSEETKRKWRLRLSRNKDTYQFFEKVEPFQVSVYKKNSKTLSDSLIFFHRHRHHEDTSYGPSKEIYVLPTRGAWIVVKQHCDGQFPIRIAQRLIDFQSVISIDRKELVGIRAKTDIHYKANKKYSKDLSLRLHYIQKYKATTNGTSSLRSLPCFPKSTRPLNIQFSVVHVRILRTLEEEAGFHIILDHLSKIYHGIKTLSKKDEEEKDVDIKCFHDLMLVDNEGTVGRLERAKASLLYAAIYGSQREVAVKSLEGFELSNNLQGDWSISLAGTAQIELNNKLQLQPQPKKGDKKFVPLTLEKMTCEELIEKLRSSEFIQSRKEEYMKPASPAFLEFLENLTIRYQTTGFDKIRSKLMESIEGMVELRDDKTHGKMVCWYFSKHWYYVGSDYLLDLAKRFHGTLKKDLLLQETDHPAFLKNIPHSQNSNDPICLDNFEKDYIPPEPPTTPTTSKKAKKGNRPPDKPFDLLREKDGKLYIYYFASTLREVSAQGPRITEILLPAKLSSYSQNISSWCYRVWQNIQEAKTPLKYKNVKEFHKRIVEADVVLVIGNEVGHKTLKEESDMKDTITVKDIQTKLEKCSNNPNSNNFLDRVANALGLEGPTNLEKVSKRIFKALKAPENLSLSDDGELTGKFVKEDEESFKLFPDAPDLNRELYRLIIQPFQPRFDNMRARLEIIRIHDEIGYARVDLRFDKTLHSNFHIQELGRN